MDHHHQSHTASITTSSPVEMTSPSQQQACDDNRNNRNDDGEMIGLDCNMNLNALCEHIQIEGFDNGSFSDVVVNAMGATYRLHRLILSRSSYFRFLYIFMFFCVRLCLFIFLREGRRPRQIDTYVLPSITGAEQDISWP